MDSTTSSRAPILGVATARSDIFAGLISSTVAVPLAMAFGMFAFVTLALQLSFFEVSALSDSLVSSAPERPCDDVCGLNALLSESGGDAADFLD